MVSYLILFVCSFLCRAGVVLVGWGAVREEQDVGEQSARGWYSV